MVKGLLERLIRKGHALYLAEHPTKTNGYSTRDLLALAGPVEDRKVPRVLGVKPDDTGRSWAFGGSGAKGESAWNWEEVLKDLRRWGGRRVRIFVADDLPGLEEAIRKIFPELDGPLCSIISVQEALNQVELSPEEGPEGPSRGP